MTKKNLFSKPPGLPVSSSLHKSDSQPNLRIKKDLEAGDDSGQGYKIIPRNRLPPRRDAIA